MSNDLPTVVGAAFSDALNALNFWASSLAGAGLGLVPSNLLSKRAEEGRRIFLEEISEASRPIQDVAEADEFVAIIYRYWQVASEGAARLNLRLMAKVIRGQIEGRGLYASDFLRFCPIIATLTREEVILLAKLYRYTTNSNPTARDEEQPHCTDKNMQTELIPKVYATKNELDGATAALLRTGLLVFYSGYGGIVFRPSPLLSQIVKLADFEAALDAEPEDRVG